MTIRLWLHKTKSIWPCVSPSGDSQSSICFWLLVFALFAWFGLVWFGLGFGGRGDFCSGFWFLGLGLFVCLLLLAVVGFFLLLLLLLFVCFWGFFFFAVVGFLYVWLGFFGGRGVLENSVFLAVPANVTRTQSSRLEMV